MIVLLVLVCAIEELSVFFSSVRRLDIRMQRARTRVAHSKHKRRTNKRSQHVPTKRPKTLENRTKTEPKAIPDRSGRIRGASGAIWGEPGRARSTRGDARESQKLAKDTQLEPKTTPKQARRVKKSARACSRRLFGAIFSDSRSRDAPGAILGQF